MANKHVALFIGAALSALPAVAQEAGGGRPGGGLFELLIMPIGLVAIFYFLLIRPQQQRAKKHKALIEGIKKGDTVITSGGLVGKVTKAGETEITVELADGVRVQIIKQMIIDVRDRNQPVAAND